MRKLMLLLLLPVLLIGVFLLYSVLKVKGTPSVALQPSPGMKDTMLYRHVEELAVSIGSRSVFEYDKLIAAKEYILSSLRGMGHTPVLQDFIYQERSYSNIIVALPGNTRSDEVVVIGAHYDTVGGTPGADDNASAVAVLLEMARRLKDHPLDRTLKLVFFTLEEPPVFRSESMGSFVYARDARNRQEQISAMVCLEMLGYYSDMKGGQSFPVPLMSLLFPSTPDFIAVVGNFASRGLVNAVSDSLRRGGSVPVETLTTFGFIPGVDFSDHRSFWKMGYPAVMITDTAFYRNPNYHRETDRIDTLDFNRLASLLDALVATAKDMSRR